MAESIIDQLIDSGLAETASEDTLDGVLAAHHGKVSALFFTGDAKKKPQTMDLAVVLREIARDHGDALRLVVVERGAEKALTPRFRVTTLPSVAFVAGGRHIETIPKMQDWAVYQEKLPRILAAVDADAAAQGQGGGDAREAV